MTHFGVITYSGFLDKVWPQTKWGNLKKNKAEEAQENPYNVYHLASQEKGLRRGERTNSSPISSRRIPKPRGAQNGTPRKTPRSRTHGQNGQNRQKRRDTEKEKGNNKSGACEGVSCDFLIFVSKKAAKNDVGEKTKGKENDPQKTPDLTSREFFRTISGSEPPKMKQKHRQKPPKNTRPTQPPKNKSSLPKKKKKNQKQPLERKNDKKRQKTPNQTSKTQNDKNEQHFPLGGTRTISKNLCDSTVAMLTSPTPFLGCALQHSAGRGLGGETEAVCQVDTRDIGPHPFHRKHNNGDNPKGAKDV